MCECLRRSALRFFPCPTHRIRPGQGSKAAVRQPTRPRQAVSKAQGNTPKVRRRMSLQLSLQLSVPQGAKHGLARESCLFTEFRRLSYSTSPRNGNRVNGNHLGICFLSSRKNGNSLTWVLVALTVCFTYPVLYRVSSESRAGEWA